jgi:uncharacterized protein YybS (DUF2232 family)
MEMENRRFLLHLLVGTAAAVLIFLTSFQVPILGIAMSLLKPLPLMILSYRWGLRAGGLAALMGSLVISLMVAPLLGIIFFAEFGLLGLVLYHYVVRRGLSWDRGILFSSIAVLGVLILLVFVYGMAASLDIVDWMRGEILETTQALLPPHPAKSTTGQNPWVTPEKLTEFILRVLPALMILTVWLEGIVNVALLKRITNHAAFDSHRFTLQPEFSAWLCPDRLVWAGILGGFLILTKNSVLVIIGINMVILLAAIYFLQGIAIISFFFKKRSVPLGLRVMGYTLIGIIQVLPILVAALGLFDIWIDFRKLRPRVAALRNGS